jgi:hypothetical protein
MDTGSPAAGTRTITHDDLRRRQEALLHRLIDALAAAPQVLGLAASGSYARGANDGFSDLDQHCYLRDQDRTGARELHERVAALAPTLSTLYLYDRNGLYLYADGVRLDLTYYPPSAVPTHAREGVRVLYDPDGALARDLGAAHRPATPSHPRFFEAGDPVYVAWFLWMIRQAYAAAKRGAQGGERATAKLISAAASLDEVRTSLMQMRLWTLDQPFNIGGADPELAALLARTYPHLTPDELLAAARTLLVAYERVCPDYCRKAGVPYPAEEVAALRRVLDEFDRLR